MAELNVQPKKKKSALPWLLLVLGVAVLIWYFATRHKSDDRMNSTYNHITPIKKQFPVLSMADALNWSNIHALKTGV